MVKVLPAVRGVNDRRNDVLFKGAEKADKNLIFFGGDVQNYKAEMEKHRDNRRYAENWSLERTAERLSEAVPEANVILVKPAQMDFGTFSIYSNFVHFENEFTPKHTDDHKAVEHLRALLLSLEAYRADLPKIIMGFSKGVVVLNQLLHEFHSKPAVREDPFVKSIKKMVWLDGGHNGGKETWVTNMDILENFASMGISVDVRVTPYQVEDPRRPWIKSEEKRFCRVLQKKADFRRKVYFGDEEASIENHFRILSTLSDLQ